jgi:Na+/H+ antiporter NhaD/arsenite permease-like protein
LWQAPADIAATQLRETSAEVSEIVFFLMGAMTIVEIVDSHQGFKIVTDSITTRNPRLLLWVVGWCYNVLSELSSG